ncbi:hypothetical protein Tco_0102648, partial [Tanacetum coccineum]
MRTLGHDAAYAMTWGTLKKKLTDKYCPKGEIKKLKIKLWNLRSGETMLQLILSVSRNVMSARPKTLDDAIELANDLMDQKLHTYAERQNDNKRKADDLLRNNHQQQPYKKQNVAGAYTAGPGEKKAYKEKLPKTHPSVENARGMAMLPLIVRPIPTTTITTTTTCYECGNTRHMRRDYPKLKNRGNGNGNGTAQGRAYALGGRDASPDSNVIT